MQRRTWALLLQYDGGPYKGWQPHPQLPTVGGVVASCLRRIGVRATPFGASRTDAGVHARAQVASFRSREDVDPERLRAELAAELPSTIRALALRAAPKSFHAHWSSCGKVYRYRVGFVAQPCAWLLTNLPRRIAREDLERALGLLEAAPDVSAFATRREHGPRVRRLDAARLLAFDPAGLSLEFRAAGFGKHLVRNLVSAALQVGAGALALADLDLMLAGERRPHGLADANGLVLHRVLYPPQLDPFPDLDRLVER